jgi:hypothetical protein
MALGGTATCNAMGAGKWPDELTPFFKGADVCVLPDNDKPGAEHAGMVAARLHGIAKRVRLLEEIVTRFAGKDSEGNYVWDEKAIRDRHKALAEFATEKM